MNAFAAQQGLGSAAAAAGGFFGSMRAQCWQLRIHPSNDVFCFRLNAAVYETNRREETADCLWRPRQHRGFQVGGPSSSASSLLPSPQNAFLAAAARTFSSSSSSSSSGCLSCATGSSCVFQRLRPRAEGRFAAACRAASFAAKCREADAATAAAAAAAAAAACQPQRKGPSLPDLLCVSAVSSRKHQQAQQQLQQLLLQQQQQQQTEEAQLTLRFFGRGRFARRRLQQQQQKQHQQHQQQHGREEENNVQQQGLQQAQQELGLVLQKESALLNLENIYLSWMRNALLATSCAMIAYSLNDWHSSVSGAALLSIGGVFLMLGSLRILLVLPQMSSHCKRIQQLQQRWNLQLHPQRQQQQQLGLVQQQLLWNGRAGRGSLQSRWTLDIAFCCQLLIISSVLLLWLLAASGVAASLPPEAKDVLSPVVFRRTLRFFASEAPSEEEGEKKAES
ncbi:hypothetical protein Efla_007017 [Eimeria flavescens]